MTGFPTAPLDYAFFLCGLGVGLLSARFLLLAARRRAGAALEALREREQRLGKIASQVPGVVYQFKRFPDGRMGFPYASEGSRWIFRLDPEAIRDHADAVFALIHPDDRERVNESLAESARTLDIWKCEYRVRFADESVEWRYGNAMPQREPDGSVLWHGFTTDITEQKHNEAALNRAREAAEAASRAKSEFLANMSHEIRTPMNAILGMTDLALRSDPTPRQQDYLSKARVAARSLLGIIDDILDFSKIEAGKLEIEETPFLLADVLDKVTAIVGLKAQEKGLEFLLNTAADVPQSLVGDPLRLRQVLINLCNNAIKFTDSGEIVVVAVKQLTLEDGRTTLYFSVRDTGIGMSEEQLAKLFQPFSQADASSTRKYGGTGLGLAICKQLVQLMGGEIGAHSQPGIGSDFYFTARFKLGDPALVPVLAAAPELSDLRILVVDDSPNAREIFQGLLAGFGYHATLKASAAEGLAELERSPYDLVLLDWKMPMMDGFEMARRIRENGGLSRQPKLVMVTAYGSEEAQRRVVSEKLDGYLTKPVSASSLLDEVLRVCGKAATPALAVPMSASEVGALDRIRGMRVLLVEDNDFNQQVAKELMVGVAGLEVSIAGNGQEALAQLRSHTFDAVLMDIQMPVMDGYEATRNIRQDARWQTLPIIAMTAHAMARDREKCLAVGMNDFISKPFEPAELFDVLARWRPEHRVLPPSRPMAAEHPTEPAVFSIEMGLKHCFGKRDILEKLLRIFLDNRRHSIDEMRTALAAGDTGQAAAVAHALKANAGTIGAERLAASAMAAELAFAGADEAARATAFADCERELGLVLQALEAHVNI